MNKKMKRLVSGLLCVVFCLGSFSFAAAEVCKDSAVATVETYDQLPPNVTEQEWEVLRIVNEERVSRNKLPLTTFSGLQTIAHLRSQEIVEYFSHTRPNGNQWHTAFSENGLSYSYAGENIAAGQTTPASVMQSWMNSQGHRENILSDDFMHVGVGRTYLNSSEYRYYWTQLFCTGTSERYTECTVMLPQSMQFPVGTSIEEMNIIVRLTSNVYGECYMPLDDSSCSGFDKTRQGQQTVTVNLFGFTVNFVVTLGSSQTGLMGDVNNDGVVNMVDATAILRHALSVSLIPEEFRYRADLNGDGLINIVDATLTIRIALNIE